VAQFASKEKFKTLEKGGITKVKEGEEDGDETLHIVKDVEMK